MKLTVFFKIVSFVFDTLISMNFVRSKHSWNCWYSEMLCRIFLISYTPSNLIQKMNFYFKKQEKMSQRARSGEYGKCCTFIILSFNKNSNQKVSRLLIKIYQEFALTRLNEALTFRYQYCGWSLGWWLRIKRVETSRAITLTFGFPLGRNDPLILLSYELISIIAVPLQGWITKVDMPFNKRNRNRI